MSISEVTMGANKRSADSIGLKVQGSSRGKRAKIEPKSAVSILPRPKGQALKGESDAAKLASRATSLPAVPAAPASAPASAPPSVHPEGLVTFQQLSQIQKLSQVLVPFSTPPLAASGGAGSGPSVLSPLHLMMLSPPHISLPLAMANLSVPALHLSSPLAAAAPKVEEVAEKAAAESSSPNPNEQANKFLESSYALLKKDSSSAVSSAVETLCREGLAFATDSLLKAKLHHCLGNGIRRLGSRGAVSVAIDNYEQALKLQFDDHALRSNLRCEYGLCLKKRNEGDDINQAIANFLEVLKLPFEQNYGTTYYNLGRCYLEHPKPLEDFLIKAIDCFRKSLKYPCNNLFRSERHLQLGLALEKSGQPADLDEAKQNLLQSLYIKHDHKQLEQESMTTLLHVQQKRGVWRVFV